jgi:hypothetical protein
MPLKKNLWFLSVSFDAGTTTKGKYAEHLSWLANLSANFFLEGNLPACLLHSIHRSAFSHVIIRHSLTSLPIIHHSSLTFQPERS